MRKQKQKPHQQMIIIKKVSGIQITLFLSISDSFVKVSSKRCENTRLERGGKS